MNINKSDTKFDEFYQILVRNKFLKKEKHPEKGLLIEGMDYSEIRESFKELDLSKSLTVDVFEAIIPTNCPSKFMILSEKDKSLALEWIKNMYDPSDKIFSSSSYGIKHVLQSFKGDCGKYEGLYLTNGQFKGAMLAAGFEPVERNVINWRFRMKLKPYAYGMDDDKILKWNPKPRKIDSNTVKVVTVKRLGQIEVLNPIFDDIDMLNSSGFYAKYMIENHFKDLKRPLKLVAPSIAKHILKYAPMELVYVPNDKELFGRNSWFYYYDEKSNILYDMGVNHLNIHSLQYFTFRSGIALINQLEKQYFDIMDNTIGSDVWNFNNKRYEKRFNDYLGKRILTEMKKMCRVEVTV